MSDIQEKTANPKKRGLGRGLDALFGDEEPAHFGPGAGAGAGDAVETASGTPASAESGPGRKNLPVGDLEPSAIQPRQTFDEEALKQLTESVKQYGLLQPILVRPSQQNPGRYEIVAGERRWRAAQRAQLHDVPVIIRELADSTALEIALIENLQREDLNPVEEAASYQKLMEEYDYTAESVAQTVGKSRSYIANMTRLLQLPERVQAMVAEGKLTTGHARAIIGSLNPLALANEIVNKNLTVRQAEKAAAAAEGRPIQSRPKAKKSRVEKDVDTLALESEIAGVLGLNVSIDMKDAHAGALTISFSSLDQLDDVLRRLSGDTGSVGRAAE